MCDFITPLLAALGAGGAGATAAGATAAAGSAAGAFAGLGQAIMIGGSLIQGFQAASAAKANVRLIEQQKRTEAALNATKADRDRTRMSSMIAQQRAELAARGVQLDSPTAIYLGESAARELSFNEQSIRQTGQARQDELSAEQVQWRSRGTQAMLRGNLSAAGGLLNRGPEQWSELLA